MTWPSKTGSSNSTPTVRPTQLIPDSAGNESQAAGAQLDNDNELGTSKLHSRVRKGKTAKKAAHFKRQGKNLRGMGAFF